MIWVLAVIAGLALPFLFILGISWIVYGLEKIDGSSFGRFGRIFPPDDGPGGGDGMSC